MRPSHVLTQAPSHLFYGWVVVGATLVANMATAPITPLVFSFFVTPMSEALGVGKSTLSWAVTLRMCTYALTAPLIGRLLDSVGVRKLGIAIGIVVGASVMATAAVQEAWHLYLLFMLVGAMGLVGGGTANLVTQVPIAKWFVAKRGKATAIAMMGIGVGTLTTVPIARWLVDDHGWRMAWLVLGSALGFLFLIVYSFLIRGSPEEMGLQPDGANGSSAGQSPVAESEVQWTVKEAMRTPAFWMALGAFSLTGFCISSTVVYRVAYWEDLGFSRAFIASVTIIDPITAIATMSLVGFVNIRLPIRPLALVCGALYICSGLSLVFSHDAKYMVVIYFLFWGTAGSAFLFLHNLVWPELYGRRFVGSIRGIVAPVTILSTGAGIPVFGYLFDSGLSDRAVWTITLGILTAGAILFALIRPPKRRPEPKGALA